MRALKFDYPSQPNFIYVQEPKSPYFLDCQNIEKVVTRKIVIKQGKGQKKNLLELLIPPKGMGHVK